MENLNVPDFQNPKFQQHFNCCAFFTGCNYEWEPIKSGCMVVLDFDIVWRTSPTSVNPISLPSFLAATKEIKEILSSWNYPPLEQRKKDEIFRTVNVEASNFSAERRSVAGPSNKALCSAFPSNDSQKDSEEYSQDNHILVVPLDETYYQTNFQFSSLRDKDRQIVQIFQSIDFVDVHLATVMDSQANIRRHDSVGTRESCAVLPKIAQWIHSDHSIPQFKNDHVHFKNVLVNCHEVFGPVIVIQPRHQSIRRCCDSQFDVALNYLESRLTSGANWETIRLHSLTCLGCVLQFCQENPLKVWDVPEPRATERTLRLFKICHRLNAESETRFLIEILGQDFKGSGVRNELVARSIADLFWNIQQGNYFI